MDIESISFLEFGDEWHEDGRLFKKQNVFDDVVSVAEYLVDEKIAAKGKIIVNGGSNGGLGAMAVGNQAPEDLLGAGKCNR
jgi:prolyl oligopeptidase